jgi:glutamyl-tRNA reductase
MPFLMTGLSHHTAPVEIRERFAFTAPGQQAEALSKLARALAPAEVVLLSTCNRTEAYVAGSDVTGEQLRELLRGLHPAGAVDVDDHCFVENRCGAAATHLFRVTSGLESMVVGETDIVRQVRDAYGLAAAAGTTGPRLDALFHEALRVAKRARSEMDLSRGVFSVGGAAADLAGSIFGDLGGRSILLLGAGKMSETTARHLAGAGANTVLVANRTRDRAVRLAETLGGRAVSFDDLDNHLAVADIVIASTAAPHCIVTAERLAPVMRRRRGRDLFLIDIALPRDIEPACARIDGVFLYDLDDLQKVVDAESGERNRRATAAAALLEREAEAFIGRIVSTAVSAPLVTEFRNKHRGIVDDELARLRRRLPHLGDDEWRSIEAFAGSVLNKIAHEPTVRIREYAEAHDSERLEAARELLGLAGNPEETDR